MAKTWITNKYEDRNLNIFGQGINGVGEKYSNFMVVIPMIMSLIMLGM